MKHGRSLAALFGVLLWGTASRGDITNTTPYDYDQPPAPGKEQGTYMAAATGSFGPDCFFTAIEIGREPRSARGYGGEHGTKLNVKLSERGRRCACRPLEHMPGLMTPHVTDSGD